MSSCDLHTTSTVKLWEYRAGVLSAEESKKHYDILRTQVSSEKKPVLVYGKTYLEPRYTNFFSQSGFGYFYSGTDHPSAGWPDNLVELASLAQTVIGCADKFDSALVNYYPDGEHYISPHCDKDALYGYIASFSFGAARNFVIRSKESSAGQEDDHFLTLEDGSLLIMKPGMQQRYTHSLPKMKSVKTGRINVTLRQHQQPSNPASATGKSRKM